MDPSLYCRAGRVRNAVDAVGLILVWQIPIDIFRQDFCPDFLTLPALQRTYGVHLTPSPLWVAMRSTAGADVFFLRFESLCTRDARDASDFSHLLPSHRFLHGACSCGEPERHENPV